MSTNTGRKARQPSGETKNYLREVRRSLKDSCRDLKNLSKTYPQSFTALTAIEKADTLLANILTSRGVDSASLDATSSLQVILDAAKAACDCAVQLQENQPIVATGLQLVSLTLVRSIRTILESAIPSISSRDIQPSLLEQLLSPFESLPHGDLNFWLENAIASVTSEIENARTSIAQQEQSTRLKRTALTA